MTYSIRSYSGCSKLAGYVVPYFILMMENLIRN